MNNTEIWKPIKGYYGFAVSNKGNVKALERDIEYSNGKVIHRKERLLSQHIINSGYKIVDFNINNVHKRQLVHILVAKAFIDNPNGYKEVNHKDENKLNNCVENLEWCTPLYNKVYSNIINKGAEAVSKAVRAYTKDGSFNEIYKSIAKCAKAFGCRHSNIRYHIINKSCNRDRVYFEYYAED